jgi:hypothetical protein
VNDVSVSLEDIKLSNEGGISMIDIKKGSISHTNHKYESASKFLEDPMVLVQDDISDLEISWDSNGS